MIKTFFLILVSCFCISVSIKIHKGERKNGSKLALNKLRTIAGRKPMNATVAQKFIPQHMIIPELFIPTTAEEANEMYIKYPWYKRGPMQYYDPMFRNNRFVIRYYIISKGEAAKEYNYIKFQKYVRWIFEKDGIKPTVVTAAKVKEIHAEIEQYTCLYFSSIDMASAEFKASVNSTVILYNFYKEGCGEIEEDFLGRHPGVISINLGTCTYYNQVMLRRAVMQVLGFIPEHRRPDRNSYILFRPRMVPRLAYILFSMVNYNFAPNIDMKEEPFVYDYSSITHYHQDEYKAPLKIHRPKHVLTPLCKFDGNKLGGDELSDRDKKRLQILYSCDKLQTIIEYFINDPEKRDLFYYDAANGYTPWGYRKDISHHYPDKSAE
ncbi:hypothetical protein B4U80_12861 [Leptotrombidium deliense]|uniref:Peptidase M12A domain-containing protein n=1 Tax=Leptotrombidium deliense TaxID=299467 RepID=A0A443SJ66_9ACAR|nr:hypothetical protein B4U80_12861 [Leptotrombidium deliense]